MSALEAIPPPIIAVPPDGWPTHMVWPPPARMIEAAQQARYPKGQMHLFGRPAFVIDGIALTLVVELTGHRDLVFRPRTRVFDGAASLDA
jgi:hypothetical protein